MNKKPFNQLNDNKVKINYNSEDIINTIINNTNPIIKDKILNKDKDNLYRDGISKFISLSIEECIELYENIYDLNDDEEEMEGEIADIINYALILSTFLYQVIGDMKGVKSNTEVDLQVAKNKSKRPTNELILELIRKFINIQEQFPERKFNSIKKIRDEGYLKIMNELIPDIFQLSVSLVYLGNNSDNIPSEVLNGYVYSKLK